MLKMLVVEKQSFFSTIGPSITKCFHTNLQNYLSTGIDGLGIDLRGFGDSDKPWDGYNYDTMADDLR